MKTRARSESLFKKLISIVTAMTVIMLIAQPALANVRFERLEMMWNDATDAERYYMSSDVKAYACGLSTSDFIFFARVVEGEGADSDDNRNPGTSGRASRRRNRFLRRTLRTSGIS